MKASNQGNVKTAMVYIIDLQVTSNDPKWPQKWKLKNNNFMYIKWKLVTQAIWYRIHFWPPGDL